MSFNLEIKIYSADEISKIREIEQSFFPEIDPFLSCEYFDFQNMKYQRNYEFLIANVGKDYFVYPYFKNEISSFLNLENFSGFFDIEGPYGYNGAYSKIGDEKKLEEIKLFFEKYCLENNIVAEFTRFNPVLNNHLYFKDYYTLVQANRNVVLDLSIDDFLYQAYEHSTRKNLKKCHENQLSVEVLSSDAISDEYLKKFEEIYYSTMDRNAADNFYYFDLDYFKKINQSLAKKALYFFTKTKEGEVISCELVLYSSLIGYSFLGGTLKEFFQLSPNTILKDVIIKTLKDKGCKFFCLGGGASSGDGIFKYKLNFAKNGEVPFYIGKKIHNEKIYKEIVEIWARLNPEKNEKFKNILFKYHY